MLQCQGPRLCYLLPSKALVRGHPACTRQGWLLPGSVLESRVSGRPAQEGSDSVGQGRVQPTGCPGLSGSVPSCRDPVTPGLPSSLHRPAVGGLLREYMTSSFLGRRDFPQVTAEAAQAQRGDPMRPVRPHGWSRGELGFGFRAKAQGTPELSQWRSHTCGWEAVAPSQSCRGAAGAFVQPLHSLSLSFPIRRRQGRPCFSPSPPGAAWKADPGLAIPSPRSWDCLREPPPWRLCPASVSPAKSQAQLQVAGFGGGRLPAASF